MPSSSSCRIDPIIDIVGDQWTLGIVHELSIGPRRAVELFDSFTGLSTKTLTARLKMLERHSLVLRKSYSESPPRVEYALTEKGRDLLPVLKAMAELSLKWRTKRERASLDAQPECRACDLIFGELPGQDANSGDQELAAARRDQATETRARSKARRRTDVTLL